MLCSLGGFYRAVSFDDIDVRLVSTFTFPNIDVSVIPNNTVIICQDDLQPGFKSNSELFYVAGTPH